MCIHYIQFWSLLATCTHFSPPLLSLAGGSGVPTKYPALLLGTHEHCFWVLMITASGYSWSLLLGTHDHCCWVLMITASGYSCSLLGTQDLWSISTCYRCHNYSKLIHWPRGDVIRILHNGIIKWKHFPHYRPFVWGIHWSPVNSPHKVQWHRALMFSLIYTWKNGWVNNGDASDLRNHRAHYDVMVMKHVISKCIYYNLNRSRCNIRCNSAQLVKKHLSNSSFNWLSHMQL